MNLPTNPEDQAALLRASTAGNTLRVTHDGSERVLVIMSGVAVIDTTPEKAVEKSKLIKGAVDLAKKAGESTIVFAGRDIPLQVALIIAGGLYSNAQLAMEKRPKEAEKLAFDGGLLLRVGLGHIGLTNNPKIMDMARVEAESNRDLRRYLPGGIKSEVQLGTPAVHQTQDSVESIAAQLQRINEKSKE